MYFNKVRTLGFFFFILFSTVTANAQENSSNISVNGTNFVYEENSLSITDSRGVLTRYLYNNLGMMIEEQSAERGSIQYTYDKNDNISRQVSEGGLIFKRDYDAQKRMTREVMKQNGVDRKVNRYSYDNCENGTGRLCRINSDGNVTKYTYNKDGKYSKVSTKYVGEDTFEITRYIYDEKGQLVKLHYPTGLTVFYHYLDDGFVHKITGRYDTGEGRETFVLAKNINFDLVSSRIKNLKFGNGLKLVNTYGVDEELEKIELLQGRDVIDISTYSRDESGYITSIDRLNTAESQSFAYNALGHLISEQRGYDTESLETISYNYDTVGNRVTRQEGTQSKSYNYAPDANRLDQLNQKSLSYDVRGNLLVDQNNRRSFEYDVTNRMSAFYKNGELKASYDYNAFGQRIRKTLRRSAKASDSYLTLKFAYTPDGQLLSENGNSSNKARTFVRDYVWLGNRPVAQIERKIRPDGTPRKAKISYIHTDHLNAPHTASDESGKVVWKWNRDAYGKGQTNRDVDGDGQKTVIRLRFPGQYYDRESGLFYNHHRDYDPKLGRYIQSDPIGLYGGINRYAYVRGNPVNYTDPKGLSYCIVNYSVQLNHNGEEVDGSRINHDRTCQENGIGGISNGGPTNTSGTFSGVPGSSGYTQYANSDGGVTPCTAQGFQAPLAPTVATTAGVSGARTATLLSRVLGIFSLPFILTGDSPQPRFDVYYHYGYFDQAALFAGGLNAGGFATDLPNLTGSQAQQLLALPVHRSTIHLLMHVIQ